MSDKYINKKCGLHCREYQVTHKGHLGVFDAVGKFTKCACHEHITREEREKIVDKICNEFVNAGPIQTIIHFGKLLTQEEMIAFYETLKDIKIDMNTVSSHKMGRSSHALKRYMIHVYEVSNNKGVSFCKRWTLTNIKKTFHVLDKAQATVNSQFTEFCRALFRKPITIYSPEMTKGILDALEIKAQARILSVFDPCSGWGGRTLGTTCRGGHYTGCEPCIKTYRGLCKMINELDIQEFVTLYNKGVEDVIPTLHDTFYDVCLTSPPYYDLEVYSKEDSQSIEKYNTYELWIMNFIRPIIEYVCEHVVYYSCWSVKNMSASQPLLDDVIKIHKDCGWTLVEEYKIKNGTDHTYVFASG